MTTEGLDLASEPSIFRLGLIGALAFGLGVFVFGLGALAFGLGALAFGLGALAFGLGALAFGLGAVMFGLDPLRRRGESAIGHRVVQPELGAVPLQVQVEHDAGQPAGDRLDRLVLAPDQAVALHRGLQVVLERVEEEVFGDPEDVAIQGHLLLTSSARVDLEVISMTRSGPLPSSQAR